MAVLFAHDDSSCGIAFQDVTVRCFFPVIFFVPFPYQLGLSVYCSSSDVRSHSLRVNKKHGGTNRHRQACEECGRHIGNPGEVRRLLGNTEESFDKVFRVPLPVLRIFKAVSVQCL